MTTAVNIAAQIKQLLESLRRPSLAPFLADWPPPSETRALHATDETVRIGALLELHGVGVPTASTLLYAAFPADYPILDVRALESLGVKARSGYPITFWLGYLDACRRLARASGVSLRTLDKALWQRSKELSAASLARAAADSA